MNQVAFRSLAAEDYSAWLPLWQDYQAFYRVSIPPATTQTTWTRLLDPVEPMAGAIAVDEDGTALGIVHHIQHRSCWTVGDYCYLQDLFVAEEARGRGIGRGLIEYVYAAAKVAGCSRVYWLTHETNREAMLVYEKVAERSGFVQYRKLI